MHDTKLEKAVLAGYLIEVDSQLKTEDFDVWTGQAVVGLIEKIEQRLNGTGQV